MGKELVLIGTQALSEMVIDLAVESGFSVIGLIDDFEKSKHALGFPVLGPCTILNEKDFFHTDTFIAVGSNRGRKKIFEKIQDYKLGFPSIVHPKSYTSKSALIGVGNLVMPNSFIGSKVKLGSFNLCFPNSSINHHNEVEDFNFIGPGVSIGGFTKIGNMVKVGMNSVVSPYIRVSDQVEIEAGSVFSA